MMGVCVLIGRCLVFTTLLLLFAVDRTTTRVALDEQTGEASTHTSGHLLVDK